MMTDFTDVLDSHEVIQAVQDSMFEHEDESGTLKTLGTQADGLLVTNQTQDKWRFSKPLSKSGKSAKFKNTNLMFPSMPPNHSSESPEISNVPEDPVSFSTPPHEKYYSIAQVAKCVGSYAQYIRTIVDRFEGFLSPKRLPNAGSRETYFFHEKDIQKIADVIDLVDHGKSLKEAVSMTRDKDIYQHIADELMPKLRDAQVSSPQDGEIDEGWVDIVATLAQNPTLSPVERELLIQIIGYRRTLAECVSRFDLKSETEARELLADARSKASDGIFDILYMGRSKKPGKVK